MRLNYCSRAGQRLALAFALVVLISIALAPSVAAQPPMPSARAVAIVLEDQGKIIVEHGYSCDTSDSKEGPQSAITLKEKLIIPHYADRGTVILNGWFAEYLHGDQHVRDLRAEIRDINVSKNVLTWTAEGLLRNEAFDDGYHWCYHYTALAWNSKLIDAIPETSNLYNNAIISSSQSFPSEETALVTLESHIQSTAFAGKEAIAVLPRGFGFGWQDESRMTEPWHAVDHHLLQIAYNLDHTELFLPKGKSTGASYDQGAISWVTHAIFKDNDAKRDFLFFEGVSGLGGNDVGVVHPPFAIRPKQISGGAYGEQVEPGGTVSEERITIENIPFEYAVPVLTGWDLYYWAGGDQHVLRAGVWLDKIDYDKKPGAATGTLSYSLFAILSDDDGLPSHVIRHRATILGLVKTGAPAADLVPVLSGVSDACHREGNQNWLGITVKNQGNLDAGPSLTTVLFANKTYVDEATPAIAAGTTTMLSPILAPGSCFTPNCEFRVTIDSKQQVKESNKSNNVAEGQCKG